MATSSLGLAKLKAVLDQVGGLHVEWRDIADAEPNDYFAICRAAGELSLYGSELTEALAARWESLNAAQKLLAVALAEKAPARAIVPMLESSLAPDQSYMLRLEAIHALATADPELAKDVLQETNRLLWRRAPDYDPRREFLPWAFAHAFNQVRAARKRLRRERLVFHQDDTCKTPVELFAGLEVRVIPVCSNVPDQELVHERITR